MPRILLTVVMLAMSLTGGVAQTPISQPTSRPPVVGLAKYDLSEPGMVGQVKFRGAIFRPREVLWPPGTRNRDMALERLLARKKIYDESLLADPQSRGLQDCVVYLEGVEVGEKRPNLVKLSIQHLSFNERVSLLRPGGQVRIHNQDDRRYVFEIHVDGAPKRDFEIDAGSNLQLDLPEAAKVTLIEKTFGFIRTNIYFPQWRPALITGKDGTFRILGVQEGQAKLSIKHPALGETEKMVTVDNAAATLVEVMSEEFSSTKLVLQFENLHSDENPVVRVNETSIGRPAFAKVLKFLRYRYDDFAMPDATLKRYLVSAVFAPLVSSLRHHEKEIAQLMVKAPLIDKALRGGRSLAEVARDMGAQFSETKMSWVTRRDLEPWLGSQIFSAPTKVAMGPILSAKGLHYFRVQTSTGRGGQEKRKFRQIFFPYQPGLSRLDRDELVRQLAQRARVEALDPALKGLIADHHEN